MIKERSVQFDYSKLRGRIKEKFGNYAGLETEISFTPVTLSRKLNHKGYFGSDEILELSKALEINENEITEYFFNVKVRKSEPQE